MKKLFTIALLHFLLINLAAAQGATRGELLRLYYTAQTAHHSGNDSLAIATYKKIIQLVPKLPDAYQMLGDVYASQSDNPESVGAAIIFYRQYLELELDHKKSEQVRSSLNKMEEKVGIEKTKDMLLPDHSVEQTADEIPVITNQEGFASQSELNKIPVIQTSSNLKIVNQEKDLIKLPFEVVINKSYNSPTQQATPVSPSLLEGRWCSSSRDKSGRENWIFDIKSSQDNMQVTLSDASAMYTQLKNAHFSSRIAESKFDNGNLHFSYTINRLYSPFDSKYDIIKNTIKGLSKWLMPSWLGWLADMASDIVDKKQKKDLPKTYSTDIDFNLNISQTILKGSLQAIQTETKEGIKKQLDTEETECEFYKVASGYKGFSLYDPISSNRENVEQYENLYKRIEMDAETNDNAKICLGILSKKGIGTKESASKVIKSYLEVAKQGNVDAMNKLASEYMELSQSYEGFLKFKRAGYEKNAFLWNNLAISRNDPTAMCFLADTYYQRNINGNEVVGLYTKASTLGSAYADNKLGELHIDGSLIEKNTQKAITYFQKAANAGEPKAMYNLYKAYLTGSGVTPDVEQAVQWLTQSIKSGNYQAFDDLANLYMKGLGVSPDYMAATQLLNYRLETEASAWQNEIKSYGYSL